MAGKKVDYTAIGKKQKEQMQAQATGKVAVSAPPEAKKEPLKESTPQKPAKRGAQRGLPDGWTRFTVTVPIELAERMKDLAYTERKKIKKVVVEAFEAALEGKELQHRPDDEE